MAATALPGMSAAAPPPPPPGMSATEVEATIASWFSQLSQRIQVGASSIRESSVLMAQQIALRFNQISGSITGKCAIVSYEDSPNMTIPRDHKELFDYIRKNNKAAYKLFVNAAKRFQDAETDDQVIILSEEMPVILQSLRFTTSR